eukprot:COSAG03_NODE_24339_length_273_cov_0.591954_1_plen_20_part_01
MMQAASAVPGMYEPESICGK